VSADAWSTALRTLLMNWRGMATVPSRHLYPHQWSWDSAFISIGLARWHQARAQSELATVFAGQWASGMLPHIVFNRAIPDEAYFPGPTFWRAPGPPHGPAVATSGITQPPVHAGAALEVYRRAFDSGQAAGFLARLYPRLARQLGYLKAARDIGGAGLLSVIHPWESGLDNSPFWDEPLAGLPADDTYPVPDRPDIAVVDHRERPGGREYSLYVLLAEGYRDSGYRDGYLRDEHPFVVEDPLFNACYLWSLEAMAQISELLGHDGGGYRDDARAVREALVARLWNPAAGLFSSRDVRRNELSGAITVGGLVPVLVPGLPRAQLDGLAATLASEHFRLGRLRFGVPSNALDAATFDARLYWRGPSWVNTNWMLWKGLREQGYPEQAELVRAGVLESVRTSGPYEYFDPFNGTGRGSAAFSWTAALVMDMVADCPEAGAPLDRARRSRRIPPG
jgi:glycogen debranching enzyme